MPISRRIGLILDRERTGQDVPFDKILQEFLSVHFDPQKSKACLKKNISEYSLDESFFDLSAFAHGGFIASDRLLYPDFKSWYLLIQSYEQPKEKAFFPIPNEKVGQVAGVLRYLMYEDDALLKTLNNWEGGDDKHDRKSL